MARTVQQQVQRASATDAANQGQSYQAAQNDIGQFNGNEATLASGRQVAANPWQNPTYLANQNRLTSSALNAENNAAGADLAHADRRTGGLNTGADIAAKTGLALNKMRLANNLTAGRNASDYNKNVGYQTEMAKMPLEAARAEEPLYATSTSGETAANDQLVKFGLQSQGFWDQLAMKGIDAATSAAGAV